MTNQNCGIPVLEYEQPGGVFYACVIPADKIIHRLEIRRRSEYGDSGIQRDENAKRVREIENYSYQENAIFPTPVIISAKTDQIFIENGSVSFHSDEGSLGHVLDGQHRILGMRALSKERLKSFNLLVVFVFDIDIYSEATIFSTINGNQKQVSKSLMYDLFSLQPGRSIGKTCHEIAKSLHDDPESPFHGRIKILGTKVGENETLSQAAFVDQLMGQIKDKENPLHEFYTKDSDWAIRKILVNCFSAIDKARPKDSKFPSDYFYRTSGYGGVVQALGKMVTAGIENANDVSEDFFYQVMTRFFHDNDAPPAGVGNSAMLDIRRRFVDVVQNLN